MDGSCASCVSAEGSKILIFCKIHLSIAIPISVCLRSNSKYLAIYLRRRRRPPHHPSRTHSVHNEMSVCVCGSFIKVGGLNDIIPLVLISSVLVWAKNMAQCSSSLQNDWGERIYMKRLCNSYHTNDRRSFQCTQLLRWSRLGLARLGLAWLGITCTRPPNRHIYTHVCIRMHYKGKPFFLAKSKMKIEWL